MIYTFNVLYQISQTYASIHVSYKLQSSTCTPTAPANALLIINALSIIISDSKRPPHTPSYIHWLLLKLIIITTGIKQYLTESISIRLIIITTGIKQYLTESISIRLIIITTGIKQYLTESISIRLIIITNGIKQYLTESISIRLIIITNGIKQYLTESISIRSYWFDNILCTHVAGAFTPLHGGSPLPLVYRLAL